jgi:hypothetical protein
MPARIAILACASMVCAIAASRSPEALRTRHGFVWKTDRSATFEYFFEPSSTAERDIEKIKTTMEQSRAHTLGLLGESTRPPGVPVFIVETRHRMKELTGTPQNAWSNPKVISFVYGAQAKAVGAHEDCHILARRFGEIHMRTGSMRVSLFMPTTSGGDTLCTASQNCCWSVRS